MNIRITIGVEQIDNGYIVTHEESGRRRYAAYDFVVMREVEELIRHAMADVKAAEEPAPAVAGEIAPSASVTA